jgi:hypothetical protein
MILFCAECSVIICYLYSSKCSYSQNINSVEWHQYLDNIKPMFLPELTAIILQNIKSYRIASHSKNLQETT